MHFRAVIALVAVGTGASTLLAVSHVNYTKARSAGELAGSFSWADQKCDGAVADGVLDALENYRSAQPGAYSAGFIAARTKIEKARKTVGSTTTCDLFVSPYTEAIVGRSFSSVILRPRFPEPAWRPRLPEPADSNRPIIPQPGPILFDVPAHRNKPVTNNDLATKALKINRNEHSLAPAPSAARERELEEQLRELGRSEQDDQLKQLGQRLFEDAGAEKR